MERGVYLISGFFQFIKHLTKIYARDSLLVNRKQLSSHLVTGEVFQAFIFLFIFVVSFKCNIFCFVWMTRTYQVL